jgi:hypothetical protein
VALLHPRFWQGGGNKFWRPSILFVVWLERNKYRIVSFLVVAVFLAGLFYSNYLGEDLRYLPDEAEYVTLAHHLSEEELYSIDGEQPTAYRPPGYPALLSLVSMLGGGILHFRFLNFLLLGGCVFFTGWILFRQGFSLAGVFGSLFVIAYLVLFYTAGTLYPQTLAAFLFLIVLKIYTQDQIRPLCHVLGGGIFGFLVLTVPTFFYAFFVIGAWVWLYKRSQLVMYATLSFTAMLLVIGAWTARNYSTFDAFFFVSTNSGENLLVGNSENTTPNAGTTVDLSAYLPGAIGLNEVDRDRYLRNQALEYITSHPIESGRLYLLKVLNYFNYRNELVTQNEQSSIRDLFMLVSYGSLFMALLLRLILLIRVKASPFEVLYILLYLSSAFVTAIFFTRIRFRLPFDYLLIMVVAILFEKILRLKLKYPDSLPHRSVKVS